MKPTLLSLLFALLLLSRSLALDVRDFGALGDGRHIDSPAINAAIESAASAGGGLVVVPEAIPSICARASPCASNAVQSSRRLL